LFVAAYAAGGFLLKTLLARHRSSEEAHSIL